MSIKQTDIMQHPGFLFYISGPKGGGIARDKSGAVSSEWDELIAMQIKALTGSSKLITRISAPNAFRSSASYVGKLLPTDWSAVVKASKDYLGDVVFNSRITLENNKGHETHNEMRLVLMSPAQWNEKRAANEIPQETKPYIIPCPENDAMIQEVVLAAVFCRESKEWTSANHYAGLLAEDLEMTLKAWDWCGVRSCVEDFACKPRPYTNSDGKEFTFSGFKFNYLRGAYFVSDLDGRAESECSSLVNLLSEECTGPKWDAGFDQISSRNFKFLATQSVESLHKIFEEISELKVTGPGARCESALDKLAHFHGQVEAAKTFLDKLPVEYAQLEDMYNSQLQLLLDAESGALSSGSNSITVISPPPEEDPFEDPPVIETVEELMQDPALLEKAAAILSDVPEEEPEYLYAPGETTLTQDHTGKPVSVLRAVPEPNQPSQDVQYCDDPFDF